jgi:large subunit ribosomal protein L22
MTKATYAFTNMKENMARALAKDLPISVKTSAEIASVVRGLSTAKAKAILGRVLEMKQAIPYKRFNDGVGHRKGAGIGQGRFPQKASQEFIKIIESVEANAQAKGLSSELKIIHIAPQKGTNQYRPGRLRRRMFKRTHLEIVVEEIEKAPKNKENKENKKEKTTETKTPESKPKKKEQKEKESKSKTNEIKEVKEDKTEEDQ